MIGEHLSAPVTALVDTAWTILDAANDLRDAVTVEACRRVIDASFRGFNKINGLRQCRKGLVARFKAWPGSVSSTQPRGATP